METDPSAALFDTTDLVLLGAIGLGTAAWFSRRQLAELIFGKKKEPVVIASSNTAQQKRETNFVKVMEQQVKEQIVRLVHHHLVIDILFRVVE
jgi:NADPH-ferrihemoprotein reductase